MQVRNALWSIWLRRPLGVAARSTLRTLVLALPGPSARVGVVEALRGLPWVMRARRPLPPRVEADLRRLRGAGS
jgi:hypothetical protein